MLRFTGADPAGNSSYDEISVQWDDAAPTVSAGSDLTVNDAAYYAITALIGEQGSGVSSLAWSDPSSTAGVTLLNTDNRTVLVSISAAATTVTLQIDVTDGAGNASSYTVDIIRP